MAARGQHVRRQPPAHDRAGDEPEQRDDPRDESLLGAAKCQQRGESEHEPIQPGHERLG